MQSSCSIQTFKSFLRNGTFAQLFALLTTSEGVNAAAEGITLAAVLGCPQHSERSTKESSLQDRFW